MTHELKAIIEAAISWQQQGHSLVLATVVKLEGSSYRRPGVRMLWNDKGASVGAVSGGCVEKEVFRQAASVFETGIPKMMTYDGRYRLGCEGILYLLLEPIFVSQEYHSRFQAQIKARKPFHGVTYFQSSIENKGAPMGTILQIGEEMIPLHPAFRYQEADASIRFTQKFAPLFQLYIFGAEHDASQLSSMASQLGWEVHIIAAPDEQKNLEFFEGATSITTPLYAALDTSVFDSQTAVVLMTHSFQKDLQYVMALEEARPAYLGLLGPIHRRERLLSELIEMKPEIESDFIDRIHGPAGLNIGAESASEIAVSILSEILSVLREQHPMPLQDKMGAIHE
ncbi:XdhC family protein [Altibacter sp. HG106]|uniref:XdhC family protein n=1 Tax=Altibacter sp. HG106 TaxID=3023937 RepID=UPI002350E902|nr:XdhC/CoxI family protein [Altibacter sp. HG106]MDC7995339.1 XdhC family protein [Altibacter sp. HG106]